MSGLQTGAAVTHLQPCRKPSICSTMQHYDNFVTRTCPTCSAGDVGTEGSCSLKVPSRSSAAPSMGLYEAAVSAAQVLFPRPCCPACTSMLRLDPPPLYCAVWPRRYTCGLCAHGCPSDHALHLLAVVVVDCRVSCMCHRTRRALKGSRQTLHGTLPPAMSQFRPHGASGC